MPINKYRCEHRNTLSYALRFLIFLWLQIVVPRINKYYYLINKEYMDHTMTWDFCNMQKDGEENLNF